MKNHEVPKDQGKPSRNQLCNFDFYKPFKMKDNNLKDE